MKAVFPICLVLAVLFAVVQADGESEILPSSFTIWSIVLLLKGLMINVNKRKTKRKRIVVSSNKHNPLVHPKLMNLLFSSL